MAEILLNGAVILLIFILILYLIYVILGKVLYGEPTDDENMDNKMVVLLLLLLIFLTLLAKSSFGQTAEYDKGQTETIMGMRIQRLWNIKKIRYVMAEESQLPPPKGWDFLR